MRENTRSAQFSVNETTASMSEPAYVIRKCFSPGPLGCTSWQLLLTTVLDTIATQKLATLSKEFDAAFASSRCIQRQS
jgi:hypothetical protein